MCWWYYDFVHSIRELLMFCIYIFFLNTFLGTCWKVTMRFRGSPSIRTHTTVYLVFRCICRFWCSYTIWCRHSYNLNLLISFSISLKFTINPKFLEYFEHVLFSFVFFFFFFNFCCLRFLAPLLLLFSFLQTDNVVFIIILSLHSLYFYV